MKCQNNEHTLALNKSCLYKPQEEGHQTYPPKKNVYNEVTKNGRAGRKRAPTVLLQFLLKVIKILMI
jgi:hypothetical protein